MIFNIESKSNNIHIERWKKSRQILSFLLVTLCAISYMQLSNAESFVALNATTDNAAKYYEAAYFYVFSFIFSGVLSVFLIYKGRIRKYEGSHVFAFFVSIALVVVFIMLEVLAFFLVQRLFHVHR